MLVKSWFAFFCHITSLYNIYFSSIINNTDPYFDISGNSQIILSMCFVDKTDRNLGSVSINDEITNSSILSLPYLKTGFCDISLLSMHRKFISSKSLSSQNYYSISFYISSFIK